MEQHLAVLVVVVPMLTAPLCVLFRSSLVARGLALVASASALAMSLRMVHIVGTTGEPLRYNVGGWAPPFGIELRVTLLCAFVLCTITFISTLVLAFDARGVASSRIDGSRLYLFYSAYLLALTGLLGMVATDDLFNVFVFLEISSLASYSLISMGQDRRALVAAYSYLLIGTIGATFYLLGVGMLYQMTGTLNMLDLAQRMEPAAHTRTVAVGFGFIMVGLFIKLAVFPLHQWLPNAYTFAPAKAGAMLAGTATKVSYYVLLRVTFTVFGASFVFDQIGLHHVLLPLSLVAMFVGSAAAMFQTDLRRLLAYSSIAQVGYMTLGLSLRNQDAVTGGVVHLFNHGITKSGLFLVVAIVATRAGRWDMTAMAGAARRMPFAYGAFVLGGLSLIGVPGTAGFVSKWYLVRGAIEADQAWIAALILLSSLLAVGYVWKVVEIGFFQSAPEDASDSMQQPTMASIGMWVPTAILVGCTVLFGLWTEPTLGTAVDAVTYLFGYGTGNGL